MADGYYLDGTPDEDWWREQQRLRGCTCPCERVRDRDRIAACGGDPDNPRVVVFNHLWECHMTRVHNAVWN